MVKWKGVIKISSKMRSKMERSNKNTEPKPNLIYVYVEYKAQAIGKPP